MIARATLQASISAPTRHPASLPKVFINSSSLQTIPVGDIRTYRDKHWFSEAGDVALIAVDRYSERTLVSLVCETKKVAMHL